MSKNLFGISTLIMSIAFLIWSIGETFAYPQGPNVSMGSNPIVTIHCASGIYALSNYPNSDNPYVVPSGFDYIITDFGSSVSTQATISIDEGNGFKVLYRHYFSAQGTTQGFTLTSGIKVSSGASVICGSGGNSYQGFMSGYLVHQ